MNPRVQEIGGSLIREIAAKRKPGSIDLGLGEPSLLPTMKHFENAVRLTAELGVPYTLNAGEPALREAVAAHYLYPHYTDADNVCIMTGSQEAVYVTVKALLDPAKDEMLVVEPAFPAYAKMAKLEGVSVKTVAMSEADGFAYDPARILAGISERTRLIVICSPCNPTGRVITREAVHEISEALKQRGGDRIYVLHDEIYREQTYVENAGHFASVYPYTIVSNSVSKSNALTGLRLGWTLAPKEITAAFVKTHAWVTSCASTFAQRVALDIFSTPGALAEHSAWYRERCAAVVSALEASGLTFIKPDGSFYVCVKLPPGVNSLGAAHELADKHDVIAIPGIAFGECFEGWLRLSWVAPMDNVAEGVRRIAQFCSAATHAAV